MYPRLLLTQIVGLLAVAGVGELIGYGFKEAILFIGLPAMGGGIAAGAVPMSKMFGQAMNQDPKVIFSTMVSLVAVANALAIIGGGLMNRSESIRPSWSGDGKLLMVKSEKKLTRRKRGLSLRYEAVWNRNHRLHVNHGQWLSRYDIGSVYSRLRMDRDTCSRH